MATDGASFEIDLPVKGAGDVMSAAERLAVMTSRLESVGNATAVASAAVRASEASYRAAETAADRAAKALEKINVAAEAQRGKMKAAMDAGDPAAFWRAAAAADKLAASQAAASTKAEAAKAALAHEASALDKLRAAATSAAAAEAKAAKEVDASKKALDAAKSAQAAASGSGKLNEIAEGLGKLGGPLGSIGQKALGGAEGMQKLTASLGSAGPYVAIAVAVVALVTGIAALSAAAISGATAITIWGVRLADAARSQELLAEGIAGSVAGGKQLDAKISDLAGRMPIARAELQSMASELAKSGLKGDALSDALETAAEKAARLKFGPDFGKEMLSLDRQSEHLKSVIDKTFGGLKIDKLLEGLSHLVELFDTSNASGRAMKAVFESLFQPLIDGIANWLPRARTAFIQFEILVLKAAIAIKPFGSDILLLAEIVGGMAAVLTGVLLVALAAVVVSVTVLAGAIAAVVSVVVAFVGGILYLSTLLEDFGQRIGQGVVGAVKAATDFLSGISLAEIGARMIDGLAAGITSSAGKVLSAMTGAVSGAVSGVTKYLKIGSPSKLLADKVGEPMGGGVAMGIDDSAGGVESALESAVTPPDLGNALPTPASSGSSSSLNLAGATFIFQGVQGAEDAEARLSGLFTRLLEGDVAQLGTAVPDGA